MPQPYSNLRVTGRALVQRAIVAIVLFAALLAFAPVSLADGNAQLKRDVVTGSDFRIRLSAALALGKKKDVTAVSALSQALKDQSGAVRAAAAAALGLVGDPLALPALESARGSEKEATTKAQIEKAIATLKGMKRTKYIVSIGKVENKSGNPKVSSLFQSAVKTELGKVPGIELVGSEREAAQRAKEKNLPTMAVDSRLTLLTKSNSGSDVAIAAKVEFLIRKIPEQSLKATVKGDAKALANSRSVKGEAELAELQNDAVNAAVQSALKGAPTAIEAASK